MISLKGQERFWFLQNDIPTGGAIENPQFKKSAASQENLLKGQAGVHRVASELLLRGIRPYFPTVDDGVDLFTDTGCGLQIKVATLVLGRYHYNLKRWKTPKAGTRKQLYVGLHKAVTHLVAWGLNDDCFWIIPRNILRDTVNVSLRSIGQPKRYNAIDRFHRCLNAWDLFSADTHTKGGMPDDGIENQSR